MWHVAPWGNRARRLAPTARQTKCVCLCSWASLLCVHRQQSEKDSTIAALWLALVFCKFSFCLILRLNNLQGVWLLISPSLWLETGGLLLLLLVSHTVTKMKSDILESEKYLRSCCSLLMCEKNPNQFSLCELSTGLCCMLAGEVSMCHQAPILPTSLYDTECDFR